MPRARYLSLPIASTPVSAKARRIQALNFTKPTPIERETVFRDFFNVKLTVNDRVCVMASNEIAYVTELISPMWVTTPHQRYFVKVRIKKNKRVINIAPSACFRI